MRRALAQLKRSDRATARIVCFPFAGGHAAFTQAWSRRLPDHIELFGVQYPGPETFGNDPAARSVQAIADAVLDDICQQSGLPLILFGYSLGAMVAFEVSLRLTQRLQQVPAELIVAASRAAHLPSSKTPMTGLTDAEFIERLRELGGTPEPILRNTELLEYFLPPLRADIATAENYRATLATPLLCPITAIGGTSDASVGLPAIAAWRSRTDAAFRVHHIAGGHFFLNEQPQAVLDIVSAVVARHAASPMSATQR